MPLDTSDILPGIYAGYATVALLAVLTAVFVGAETAAYAAVAASAVGSAAFGYFTVGRGLAGPLAGAAQFARPWLWFTVWAAVGLYDGRYQPLVASAVLALAMAASHLTGGVVAVFLRRRG